MWYDIALFIHLLGVIGSFIAVGLIVIAFVRMRQAATLADIREWAGVAVGAGKSLALLSLVLLAPAIYMVIVAWGVYDAVGAGRADHLRAPGNPGGDEQWPTDRACLCGDRR